MPDKNVDPAPSKLFSVPVLIAVVVAAAGIAYTLSHRAKPTPSSAVGAPDPTFAVHSGPPSPRLPSDPKYAHALGPWCSYAGALPIYFCGKDHAACEAAGGGALCIRGGPTLWCLEKFDANDAVDRAQCYWTPAACQSEAARQKRAAALRTDCSEFSRN